MDKLCGTVEEMLRRHVVSSVVAGVSGGADSVALLRALTTLGVRTIAVHCNFHLRGDESDRDMRFVQSLCERLRVPLHVTDVDVEAYRREHGVSVEMACRETRYAVFRDIMTSEGCDRIAVAHNSDDQAETVLLNLLRGSGVAGLRGMLPDTGEVIRPLLNVNRSEILKYLESLGQDYVVDSTNLESDYRRNFLRNEVLPLIRTRWPGANGSICRTASIMAQEERALDSLERMLVGDDAGDRLKREVVCACNDPMWPVRRFAVRHGANMSQCEEMTRVALSPDYQSGKYWATPLGIISAERDGFEFNTADHMQECMPELSVEQYCQDDDIMDRVRDSSPDELWSVLPPDDLYLRVPMQGDRIKPLGMTGSVLISKIMKDAKLSREQKGKVRVAVCKSTGEIIWVPGMKRSRLFLVDTTSDVFYRYMLRYPPA